MFRRCAAAVGLRLSDGSMRSMRVGLVHSTCAFRTARHACFSRRHPAGTDADLTRGKRKCQKNSREPMAEGEHSPSMWESLLPCQIYDVTQTGRRYHDVRLNCTRQHTGCTFTL